MQAIKSGDSQTGAKLYSGDFDKALTKCDRLNSQCVGVIHQKGEGNAL